MTNILTLKRLARALLLAAALAPAAAFAVTTVDSGTVLDLSGGTVSDDELELISGSVINGTFNASSTYDLRQGTITANLTGSATATKTTSGWVDLHGTNNFSGTLTIINGRVRLIGAATMTANVHIANNGPNEFFDFITTGTTTYAGVISGYNTSVQGTGTVIWTGANTHAYTGITQGTLKLDGAGTLGNPAAVLAMLGSGAGANLDLNGTTQSLSLLRLFSGGTQSIYGGTLSIGSQVILEAGTISANITGTGSLLKSENDFASLSGNNDYLGVTQINAGTLSVSGGSALPDSGLVQMSGGTLYINDAETIGGLSGTGLVDLFGDLTVGVTGGGFLTTFSGSIGGYNGLSIQGFTTLALTGSNNYFGDTYIGSGSTLRIGETGAGIGAITSNVINSGSLEFLGEDNFVWTYSISDTGSVLIDCGSVSCALDVFTVNSLNSFSGGLTIANRIVELGISASLGTGTTKLLQGGELQLSGTTHYATGVIMQGGYLAGGTVFVTGMGGVIDLQSGEIEANLTGNASVSKTGAGVATLSGTNTYIGGTTISAGRLIAVGGSAIPEDGAVIVSGGVLEVMGSPGGLGIAAVVTETIGSLSGSGGLEIAADTILETVVNGSNTIFSGNISGPGGFEKAGTAMLTLSGANSFSGGTVVSGGVLEVTGGNALSDTGPVVVTSSGTLAVAQSETIGSLAGTGAVTIANGQVLTTGGANTDTYFDGNVSGAGGLTKQGTGIFTLAGTVTASGPVNVFGGTLEAFYGEALGDTSTVTVASGATLIVAGYGPGGLGALSLITETIGALAGAGNVTIDEDTIFDVGGTNTNSVFSGNLSGIGQLRKSGTGTLTLSGAVTLDNLITVAGGHLVLNASAEDDVTVLSGARLSGNAVIGGNLSNAGVIAPGNSPGIIEVAGNYTGGGVLEVEVQLDNAAAPVNGVTHDALYISGNVLGAPTTVNLFSFPPSLNPAATTGNGIEIVRVSGTSSAANFEMTQYLFGSYYYDIAYVPSYTIGPNTYSGFFLQSSLAAICAVDNTDNACFIDASTPDFIPIDALAGNDTLQLTGATDFTFDISKLGTLYTNFEVFQKFGTSTVTLSGVASSITQGVDIQQGTLIAGANQLGANGNVLIFTDGTLQVANALTIGSLTGSGQVVLNANLTLSGANASVYAGVISGVDGLIKAGPATATLTGNNTYAGLTQVTGGVLQIGNGGTSGAIAGNLSVSGGAAAVWQRSDTVTYAGTITGAGLIRQTGTGTLTLTGANNYSGATEVMAGTLAVSGGAAIGDASAVLVHTGATLQLLASETAASLTGGGAVQLGAHQLTLALKPGAPTMFSGVIAGTGGLTLSEDGGGAGPRQQTLTGANSFTGTSVINGAVELQIGNGGTSGELAGAVSVAGANSVIAFHRSDNSSYGGVVSGAGRLVKRGGGTLTLTAANTQASTVIEGGTLLLSGAGTFGASTGALTVNFGGTADLGGLTRTVGSISLLNGQIINGSVSFTTLDPGAGTISANLVGSGTLNKTSAGMAVLSGNNSFTGTVTVGNGTLRYGAAAALPSAAVVTVSAPGVLDLNGFNATLAAISGSGGLNLSNGALTVGSNNASTTFSGNISGTGGKLIKTGSGMLTLSGNNAFTGGIDILHGGIVLGSNTAAGSGPITTFGSVISYANGVNIAAPVVIASNTTQFEVLVGTAQQAGPISESGGARPFEKTGAGNLVLSGANSFTGITNITAGTLTVQGGQALSNIARTNIAAGATLAVASSETIGSLTGAGSLNLSSGAVLTAGGDNTSTVFNGASSGAGGLTKAGTGRLTLFGAQSFTGTLTVASGELLVDGGASLSGMGVNLAPGGTLLMGAGAPGVNGPGAAGTGLGAIQAANGATLYLDDNSSLSGASLNLAAGSNLRLFLTTNPSQRPQITVSGAASIGGAQAGVYLDPLSFSGTTATSFIYSNVISGSSLTGTFGSVSLLQSPNNLFSVSASYTGTSASLRIDRQSFSSLSGEGNGEGTGGAIETIFVGGTSDPDLRNLINTLANSDGDDIIIIFSDVSGSITAEALLAAMKTDDPWKQTVAERVNAARTPGCTVAGDVWCLRRYASASQLVMTDVMGDPNAFDWLETGIRESGTVSVWGRVLGAWARTDASANAPGSEQWTGGLITGADRVFDSLLLAGVAAQYVETHVNFDASPNSSVLKAFQIGAYVSYGGAEAYLNANAGLIFASGSNQRQFTVGLINYDIGAKMRSTTFSVSAETGTILELGQYRFEPSAALSFTATTSGSYAETGGGGLGLLIDPDDVVSLRSTVSARLSRVFDVGDRKIVPQIRIDWRHEFLDRGQRFSAAFAGAPNVTFTVDGTEYARDSLFVSGSMTAPVAGRLTAYIDAQYGVSRDTQSLLFSLGLRATW